MLTHPKIFTFSFLKAVLVLTAIFSYTHISSQVIVKRGNWEKEEEIVLNSINTGKLENAIGFLADTICAGRATGTSGSMEAAAWIQREFRNAGLMTFGKGYGRRVYAGNGKTGRNIIGILPGSISIPRQKYIIIGAHYDHLGILNGKLFPGADSNASGVAALTTLASIFSDMRHAGKVYDSNIIFVAFDAKELNLSGSQSFWRLIENGELRDPITSRQIFPEDISLMINIDQIGSTLSPVGKREDYLIMLGNNSLNRSERNLLQICNKDTGLNLDLCLSYYGSRNFTDLFYNKIADQSIFVQNRIPAVMFTSGITLNNNKTRDTVASLDMNILLKRILLIYHWTSMML